MNESNFIKARFWTKETSKGTIKIKDVKYGVNDRGNIIWRHDIFEQKNEAFSWRGREFASLSELVRKAAEELQFAPEDIAVV